MTPLVLDFVRSAHRQGETLDEMKTQLGSIEERMTGFDERLDTMNGHLGTIDGRMSKIEETQRRIDVNVGELRVDTRAGFEGLQKRMAALEAKHDAASEAADTRSDEVNTRFQAVDARFDEVNTRFEAIDARFDEVNTRFEAVDARFDEVNTKFEKVDERFATIQRQLAAIARAVNAGPPPGADSAGLGC